MCLCFPEEGSLELIHGCVAGGGGECQEKENSASRGSELVMLQNGGRLLNAGSGSSRDRHQNQWLGTQLDVPEVGKCVMKDLGSCQLGSVRTSW